MAGILENNDMKYKINFKNTIRVLRGVLIYHIVFIIFLFFAQDMDNQYGAVTWVFSIYYAIAIFPTFLLLLEYFIRNKNDVLQIDSDNNTLIINHGDPIYFHEVNRIVLFMPPVWHRESVLRIWPFEDYRYAKIEMIDGRKYIFTCLMAFGVDKVMDKFKGVNIERKVRIIASPLLE
jgi:hypothetical protein